MSFNDFQLNNHILQAIKECGFTAPTPIQKQAIAPILEGRDLLGLAQTGTGKTAAFILPTVQHLMTASGKQVRVLIIAPTRELAEQINEFTKSIILGTRLRSMAAPSKGRPASAVPAILSVVGASGARSAARTA